MKRALLLVAALAWAPTVHADAFDAALARAVVEKERALDSNAPTDWEAALAAFQEVDAVRSTADVSYEIGAIAARLRADDLAFEAFERALEQELVDPPADKARAFVAAHRDEMGRVSVRGPSGAAVIVLGRRRGTLPLAHPIVVFAGTVRVTVGNDERAIAVKVGETTEIDFTPKPTAAAPPKAPAPDVPARSRDGVVPLVAGASLFVASGVTFFVSSAAMSTHRDAIAELCPPEKLDGARCYAAPADRHADWDEHRSAYLTWSAVRTASFVGLGVGALTAAWGVVRLGSAPRTPVIVARGDGLLVGFVGAF